MTMERLVVQDRTLQAGFDAEQMAHWVNWLAPWQVIAHLTWRDHLDKYGVPHGIGQWSAAKSFERYMKTELPHLSYFYAVEQNPSRDGSHVHALWADAGNVFRKEAWASWFQRHGRARIEPVRNHKDVSDYCAKHLVSSYTTKAPIWWNVKLQWHRVQAMHNRAFELRGGTFGYQDQGNAAPGVIPLSSDARPGPGEFAGDSSVSVLTRTAGASGGKCDEPVAVGNGSTATPCESLVQT